MSLVEGTFQVPYDLAPLLIINPNSNPAVDDLVRAAARHSLPAGARAHVIHPRGSPHSIETSEDKAVAADRVLELVDALGPGNYSSIAMACFDDLALDALRDAVGVPVVGTFEAGLMAVRSRAVRFGIVTTFAGAVPAIKDLLARYGAAEAGILQAAGLGVSEAAAGGAGALSQIADAVAVTVNEGAQAVLLGSGGLTGSVPRLRRFTNVPLVDGVEAAIRAAWSLSLAADDAKRSSTPNRRSKTPPDRARPEAPSRWPVED